MTPDFFSASAVDGYRRFAVWYHRDNGSMRSSECVVFDMMGRTPAFLVAALGGTVVARGGDELLHDGAEPIVAGIGRRLGENIHVPSPTGALREDTRWRRALDHAIEVTKSDFDCAVRDSILSFFAKTASGWWYGRAAIEQVFDELKPGADRESFLRDLASSKRQEFYRRLCEKSESLAAWEKERGPHGVRGLAILPRENVRKFPRGRLVLYDPRDEEHAHVGAKWFHERLFQWLPEDRRFRPVQDEKDDLLVAVELQ